MTTYTRKNIEDWDFRGWVSPLNHDLTTDTLTDPDADSFLMENFLDVLVVDHCRLITLDCLLKSGYATLSENREDVLLNPFGAEVLRHMTSWRDVFTSQGRLNRRVVKALVREWTKNSRLRASRSFRPTCASSSPVSLPSRSAIAAGVSLFEIARFLGTSTEQIDRTYGHLLPDSIDRTRSALNALIAAQAEAREAQG